MRSFQRNFCVSPSCPLLPLQLPSPMETHVWFVLPDEFKSVSLLNQYIVDPRSLKFRKNVHGKPELVWESDDGQCSSPLHFNISHTSSLIACGVTVNSPIGIDVEEKQRKN
ncbi:PHOSPHOPANTETHEINE TRANSFERASE [Salix viminalis]|uniref:holo-[acyl-carrier-protein] synthase n=1 Tax=Salix viminalis TaxID=40686 RepID=A0A9Q0NYT0_SALVM|nr:PHOSPHOPANTETHEINE TRANSFERASE [Salix viminalis]